MKVEYTRHTGHIVLRVRALYLRWARQARLFRTRGWKERLRSWSGRRGFYMLGRLWSMVRWRVILCRNLWHWLGKVENVGYLLFLIVRCSLVRVHPVYVAVAGSLHYQLVISAGAEESCGTRGPERVVGEVAVYPSFPAHV